MNVHEHLQEGETAARQYVLAVPRGAPVNRAGVALTARPGSSLEFRDYRGYEPGDDLRHVDWNAFARSDQLSVKLFREEAAPHLDILLDGSRSMMLMGSSKARATLALAGFFTAAATNAGFSHAGWLLGADAVLLGDRTRRMEAWENIAFDYRGYPVSAVGRAASRWRPRSVRVLVSDLLWDADPMKVVQQLADRASAVVVAQVLSASDVEPPTGGYLRLIDSETDEIREVRVDAATVVRYRDNLAKLRAHWDAACRAAGAVFVTLMADDLLRDWRMDALVAAGVLQVG